jgi:hypothetical protein
LEKILEYSGKTIKGNNKMNDGDKRKINQEDNFSAINLNFG